MTATSVALRQLGYAVPEHDAGVTIYVIDPVLTGVAHVPGRRRRDLRRRCAHHEPRRRCRTPCAPTGPVTSITIRVGTIARPTPGHDVTVRLGSITVGPQQGGFPRHRGSRHHRSRRWGRSRNTTSRSRCSINSDQHRGPVGRPGVDPRDPEPPWERATSPAAASWRPRGRSGPTAPSATSAVCSRRPWPSSDAGATLFLVPQTPSSPWLKIARSWPPPELKVIAVGTCPGPDGPGAARGKARPRGHGPAGGSRTATACPRTGSSRRGASGPSDRRCPCTPARTGAS